MSDFSQRLRSLPPEKRALLLRELEKKGHQFNYFSLSYAQQQLWLFDRLEPGNPSYTISTAIRFTGHLHVAVLERSVRIVVQRHESLRTTFVIRQGLPAQKVASSANVALPLIDLSGLNVTKRESEMQRQADSESLYAFDLAQGPLLRIKLFRLSTSEHVAVVNIHHIVSDGWSTTVLLRELAAAYGAILAGQPPSLPPLPIQYADYAAWQRNWLQGDVLASHLSYWRERLGAGSGNSRRPPEVLELPADRPRPAIQTYRGNTETLLLSATLTQHLRDISQKEGVTLFMTLLAIFQILLYRYTGQEDLVVGAPIANRNRAEIEGLIGFFVNSLVLRTDLSGNASFHDLLMRVRAVALGAYAHQDLPFDKLVEELSPARNLSHTPLFQVYFNMINFTAHATTWPELTVDVFAPRAAGTKFDLTLYVTDGDEGIQLELLYNTDLFDQARMLAMLRQFAHLASQVRDVEEKIAHFSLVTPAEQSILPDPTAPLSDRLVGSIQHLFAEQALRRAGELAVVDATGSIGYQELDELSNRLAHYLRASGTVREDVIAIYAHRSLPLVPAVLGVLKAGAVCLILDPTYPPARLVEYLAAVNLRGWLHIQAAGPLPAELQTFLATSASRCRLELPQDVGELVAVLAAYPPTPSGIEVGPDDPAFITFTSGSTGQPKGVIQRHGPLSHFLPWQQQRFGLHEAERYSMLSGLAHDPLQREIFTSLCLGGTISIPPTESIASPGWLAGWMQQQAINVVHLTPAMLQLLTHPVSGASTPTITLPVLRCAFIVGDALTRREVARLYALAPAVTAVNFYGSTETQRAVGYFVIPRAESLVLQNAQPAKQTKEIIPLGQGIPDTQLLVLNAARQVAGISELGEIYIRSPHLATGYLNDAALTRERFIPNPFTGSVGDRLYRTGDLGRYRPDGNVEYAGRNDQQVKLRGFRIELAEIEAALGLHPAVREAVVLMREDTPEQKRLVAYVVPSQTQTSALNSHEIRDFLMTRLPAYMLPVVFVPLASLPLTPNRKVDRLALPVPEAVLSMSEPVTVPRTPTEEILAGIWARMLGREQVGVDDNFFDLGGHSLLATQLLARVYEAFQQEPPLRTLFETPTVTGLAAYLERHRPGDTIHRRQAIVPQPREAYHLENASEQPADSSLERSMLFNAQSVFPLSFAQERLWFLDQLDPGNAAYTILVQLHIQGKLIIKALQQSIHALVQRHETLRTTLLTLQGRPGQAIALTLDAPLSVLDLSDLGADTRQSEVQHCLHDEAQRSFDLARGPLFSLTLLRLGTEEHLFLFSIHHSIFDGWSIDVLFHELNVLYASFIQGTPSNLATLPIQYADFAVWQRQWLQGEVLAWELEYWKAQLAGAPAVLDLPTSHARPPLQTYRGARLPLKLPMALTRALEQLSRQHDVTLYMTLLAAFQTLLLRYSGQQDILVGTPIAGRTSVDVEGLIGFFVNTLVLRGDLSGDPSFRTLLTRVREVALDAYAHQDLPFEKLVEELQPERNASYSPLFQVMFILQNMPNQELHLANLRLTALRAERVTAQFDLTLVLWQEDEQLQGYLEYNTDLFEPASIERMAGHLHTLLHGIVADVDQRLSRLPLLTPAEREQLVVAWNATRTPTPLSGCIHRLFEEQAARTPNAIAVVHADAAITYAALNRRANALAHYLRQRGVERGQLVAVCLPRSLDMLVSLLGILKAGAAYVPLDPSYPQERLDFMLCDAQASLVLTRQSLRDALPATDVHMVVLDSEWSVIARESEDNPAQAIGGDDLAYVIYTSGSTGQPKGVQATHRATLNRLAWMWDRFPFTVDERCCHKTSLSFVDSVWEIFGPLLQGISIVLLADEIVKDPPLLVQTLAEQRVTRLVLVPSLLQVVLDTTPNLAARLSHLTCWISSGEALPTLLAERFLSQMPASVLLNLYGSSEVAADATWQVVRRDSQIGSVPIGRPIANTQVYLLDAQGQPVPIGVPGDLYIGGAGLARGYLHRPGLTAERFVPDPFSQEPGMRLYRTGDLARYIGEHGSRTLFAGNTRGQGEREGSEGGAKEEPTLPDGSLEFLGRRDQQIKLRGYRIELGEIEAALARHPAVRQSAVALREGEHGERLLVAYLVSHDASVQASGEPQALTIGSLRSFLAETLPEYMLPSALVSLAALPLTPNGKVDRNALPAPTRLAVERHAVREVPRTPTEELLADIWTQILPAGQIQLHENFFALGGHSLLATRMAARVRHLFGVDLSLRVIFESPTVAALAEKIDLARQGRQALSTLPLLAGTRNESEPLSFAQQRLWFLDQLQNGSSFYNIPLTVRISGTMDVTALQRSFTEIVRRHESLRTTFVARDGQPLQRIQAPFPVPMPLIDLQGLAHTRSAANLDDIREDLVEQLAMTRAQQTFDLSQGPLFTVAIVRVNSTEHIMLLTMHHIIADAWSVDVLLHELDLLYTAFRAGHAPVLPALAIQYADYAVWQRQWLQGEILEQQEAYWKAQLANAPAVLELPTDHARPHEQTYHGARYSLQLPPALSRELNLLSRAQGVTLFMTLLATFQTLLLRYSGQQDILVGTPIAGRTSVDVEGLIGFFVNTLVLRSDLSGDPSFRTLLTRVREVALDAYAHQDLPFEKLVEELQPERNLSYSPLFQVMFILQNTPNQELRLADLQMAPQLTAWVAARFDLTLVLWQEDEQLQGYLEYNTDLFEPASIERMAGHLHTLLHGIVADVDQRLSRLPLLTPAEREQLVVTWNAARTPTPLSDCIHHLFEEQAACTPDAMAVVHADAALTYAALNRRANALAHYLRKHGVGRGRLVALCVDRSPLLLVSLLGILKAGAAYVPLDPSYPQERLDFMLHDAQASLVLTRQSLRDALPATDVHMVVLDSEWSVIARESEDNPAQVIGGDDLAYVIYTSGSTGQPKGVQISHRALANFLAAMLTQPGMQRQDTLLAVTSISFDIAGLECYLPLLVGARLLLASQEVAREGHHLAQLLTAEAVTIMQATPATWRLLLEAGWSGQPALRMLCGGEALPPDLARQLLSRGAALWNLYGPTETTIWSLSQQVQAVERIVPIGRPIANTQVYLLDAQGQPVPIGIPGDLYIGGAGLARGYLHRPDLTAERFVPDPFSQEPGMRLYRTGDLARYIGGHGSRTLFAGNTRGQGEREGSEEGAKEEPTLPDGTLVFLGRNDRQVKIRGYRIEVQEIEAVLAQHPAVRQATVAVRGEAADDKQLVAYVVPGTESSATHDGGQSLTASELRAFLQKKLPGYMVPSAVVLLPSLPLMPNGKIDWKALPAPQQTTADQLASTPESRQPTAVEEVLMDIWSEVLGQARVGIFDNFFALGGHSLLATQVIARVRNLFQVDVSVLVLFESPTPAGFAESLIEDEPVPGRIMATANVRLKLKRMSPQEVHQRLSKSKKR